MARVYGGTLLARTLKAAGVRVVFGILGQDMLSVYDACLEEGITVIGNRHESASVHMADAYARLTGQPGVCLFTSGPGHANCVGGATAAWCADSPVVLISSSSELSLREMLPLQEIPQVELLQPITKWARTVHGPERIPDHVAAALRHALSGRTGPVHLSIPGDVLNRRIEDDPAYQLDPSAYRPQGRAFPDPALVAATVDLLAQAERPVLIVGSGALWSRAAEPLRDFVETTETPAFTFELARGLISDEHPLCFGKADPMLNHAARLCAEADLVLIVGKRMDWRMGYGRPPRFAPTARVVQVDREPTEVGRNRALAVGIAADEGATLAALAQAAHGRRWQRRDWLDALRAARRAHAAELAELERDDGVPIHPHRVHAEVRALLEPNAILAIDGGDFCHLGRMALPARRPCGILHIFPLGELGMSLPFALAARIVEPQTQIINLIGDGAFGFYGMEFDTAVRHDLPIVSVVGVDAAWGIEAHLQEAIFGRDRLVGSLLRETRYDQVVQGLGGYGEHVERPQDLRPALQRALASGRPACVNVRIRGVNSPMTDHLIRRKRELSA
ncbi:MAG: thiamine pyrophosphate-binding protein [Chloroflexi bacterium]|nr:thiamine pyrophosphate-binding protein [Chloroflexota bacterium]